MPGTVAAVNMRSNPARTRMRVLIADESVERAQRRDEAANARLRMLADGGSESLEIDFENEELAA